MGIEDFTCCVRELRFQMPFFRGRLDYSGEEEERRGGGEEVGCGGGRTSGSTFIVMCLAPASM